jgi:hypothetical protein
LRDGVPYIISGGTLSRGGGLERADDFVWTTANLVTGKAAVGNVARLTDLVHEMAVAGVVAPRPVFVKAARAAKKELRGTNVSVLHADPSTGDLIRRGIRAEKAEKKNQRSSSDCEGFD